jgi:uncharacterized protein
MKRYGMAALLIPALLMAAASFATGSQPVRHNFSTAKAVTPPALTDKSKLAAIIIDDFGNNMQGTAEIIALPFPIVTAVMPFMSTSKQDAEAAHLAGKEVIVHLPMEPVKGNPKWLGPGAIFTNMPDDEIRKRVDAAIDNIPHAIGVNNHMGSKVTSDARSMRIVMEELKKRNMFFIDSHTNYRSIACRIAKEVDVPCIENELFLDDQHASAHVVHQIGIIQERLKNKGHVIAIGHVGAGGKITAVALRQKLPELSESVQLLPVSKLISLKRDGLLQ